MSACELPGPQATAFQIAARLEQYEEDVALLASTPIDGALYAQVSREVEDVRMRCASLPQLSACWVHLLISHTELMHCLWTCEGPAEESPAVSRCKLECLEAAGMLRDRCLRRLSRECIH